MAANPRGAGRQLMGSLPTRIILVVFLAAFLTALVVSSIAVDATYTFLKQRAAERFPAAAELASEELSRWLSSGLEAGRAAAATGAPDLVVALPAFSGARLVVAGSPPRKAGEPVPDVPAGTGPGLHAVQQGAGVALVAVLDASGSRALVTADLLGHALRIPGPAPGTRVRLRRTGDVAGPPARGSATYAGGPDTYWVGAAHALPGTDADLVLEAPFRQVFAPVFRVVTRVVVVDLGLLALFALIAYRLTTTITRPIEALSEAARRISLGDLDLELPAESSRDEIGLLTRTFADMARELRRNASEIEGAHTRLRDQNEELRRANEVLEQLSVTDGLTQLHNHRYFQDFLTREIKRADRTGAPLAMLMIDLDDFKALNDRRGHAAGDELLMRLAGILMDEVRESDLVARYGGEEFAVVAPGTNLAGAVMIAEKIRTEIAETPFILDDTLALARVTVSIGVALFEGSRRAFFQAADQALYRAKAAGKNCVVAAGQG